MTSNRILLALAIGALHCASIVKGQDRVLSDAEVRAYYHQNIHARSSGVYAEKGWVFFHQRLPLKNDNMQGEFACMRKAIGAIRRDVFRVIDEGMPTNGAPVQDVYVQMRELATKLGSPGTRVVRSIKSLPSRVLYQRTDNGMYVYDMAVKAADLKAESLKGRFEDRPSTIVTHWINVVNEQMAGTNIMAFACEVGAFDLWTLRSGKTCGEKVFILRKEQETDALCMQCISDLKKSVLPVATSSAAEYTGFLSDLYQALTNEVSSIPGLKELRPVRIMLLSFASCQMKHQKETVEGLDVFADYVDQSEEPIKTRDALIGLLKETPGSSLYWKAFGEACIRAKSPLLAASAFRNALRLNLDDMEALDGLARAYAALGKIQLARGAARVVYALAKTDTLKGSALKLLGVK